MYDYETVNDHTQIIIPLAIKPHSHKAVPTITGNALSDEAGTVLYGHYNMEYLLPNGDRLQLIADHNKKTVQLLLLTHHPDLIQQMPGERTSSLVAGTISRVRRYLHRVESYVKPLSEAQESKLRLANECIESLSSLLQTERNLDSQDYTGQEKLRRSVIAIIEECRDENRILANNPVVSEGYLGSTLFDAQKEAQHFFFNRYHQVSAQDQMDFSIFHTNKESNQPCFIWDSEIHIGESDAELEDALRTICNYYNLNPAHELVNIPANRFEKLEHYLHQLWLDGKDWFSYLASSKKPSHKTEVYTRHDGLTITQIIPYYKFKGIPQKGYDSIDNLVLAISNGPCISRQAAHSSEAQKLLMDKPNGSWVLIPQQSKIIVRQEDKLLTLNYFIHDGLFYPLPDGNDLYHLSQVSKRHLYLPERINLKLKAFFSSVPSFFKNFYYSLGHFITHDLKDEFINHVHATHARETIRTTQRVPRERPPKFKTSIHEALEHNGLLTNGQTIEEFIKEQLTQCPYVIARANHPPSPPCYTNPFHRTLGVARHFGSIFIDTSERNPMVGTLAMAAYAFGAGAVLAPQFLTSVLTKLHLSGLIAVIEPTQKLAHLMSHGPVSEAISASVTYWQGVVAGGNLDKFFIEAVKVLKDDPAEIAIIAALALSLGYGITQIIPSLQQEMGEFPLTNYLALGAKGGAAIYDTMMNPGDDWLLGTFKWLFKHGVTCGKLLISPFVEGAIYGFSGGFINGWKKSGMLFIKVIKQTFAASLDFILNLLTIPLLELNSLLFLVPFRGITNLLSKILGSLGHVSSLGEALIYFANRPSPNHFLTDFRFSSLYGFSSPIGRYSNHLILNLVINCLSLIFLPLFQLVKNVLILPLIDGFSLLTRIILTIANPLTRTTANAVGKTIYFLGTVWDKSLGRLFSGSAYYMTTTSNAIVQWAGVIKQNLLSMIQIIRNSLFQWAFHDDEDQQHTTLEDHTYFTANPMRIEKIPHTQSHCLLNTLLGDNKITQPLEEDHPYTTLYSNNTVSDDLSGVHHSNVHTRTRCH